jgi:hypothetical protein
MVRTVDRFLDGQGPLQGHPSPLRVPEPREHGAEVAENHSYQGIVGALDRFQDG